MDLMSLTSMKKNAASIGSLVLLSIYAPLNAKAELDIYSYWYGSVVGAGASICGLLEEGVVSKKVVENFSKSFLLSIKDESPELARKQALDYIGKTFNECPFTE